MTGNVVVIGAINTDLVISAPHLPDPGETVVGSGLRTFGGGKGANAAIAASRAGANVSLIGAVGNDDWGKHALQLLKNDNIDISGIAILGEQSTGAAIIIVDAEGENQIVLEPGANGALTPKHVRDTLNNLLPTADAVLVSTEIPYQAVAAAVELASKANVLCVLNPAPVILGLVNLLSFQPILTPNELELDELASNVMGESSHKTKTNAVSENLRILNQQTNSTVISTLGSKGCAVLMPGNDVKLIPSHQPDKIVDTTGAGDTFNGVFTAQLAAGKGVLAALETAIVAASISVSVAGAREGMPDASKISSVKQLSEAQVLAN